MTMSNGVKGILILSVRNGSDLKQNLCTQSFINLNYTLHASTSRILLGIGITLSIASVVSIYLTSVVTGNQSSSSGQQLTSPSFPSTEGSSQPMTSNIESARITNTGDHYYNYYNSQLLLLILAPLLQQLKNLVI